MDSRYTYTQSDQIQPVYCTQCRAHLPQNILSQNGNICPDCAAQNVQTQQARASMQQQLATSQQQALYSQNTGLGLCPQCQSSNVAQFDNYEKTNAAWGMMGAGCLLGLLGIPLLLFFGLGILLILAGIVLFIVGGFMQNRRKISTSRQCNHCNYRWLV